MHAFNGNRKQSFGRRAFVPPDVTAASDIPYPIDNIASGVVSLGVTVSETGQVENVQMVRGISGLAQEPFAFINTWTFSPAWLDGSVPSIISVQ